MSPRDINSPGVWHVISGSQLMSLLERCSAGEHPDYVYIDAYLRAEWHDVEDDRA
jgi:hypothetical protein